VLYVRVTVPANDLREARGLLASRHWADGRTDRPRVVAPATGLAGDFARVEWSGGLFVPASGPRAVWTVDGVPVLVDGRPATTPAYLTRGLHQISVVQSGDQARAGLRLLWGDPLAGPGQPVPATALFTQAPIPTNGLLGSYYHGERWEGRPVFQRIDPLLLFGWPEAEPLTGAFSVTWRGEIEIAVAGDYVFVVESDDGARLWIDGAVIGESLKPDSANFFEVRRTLTAGRHPIQLDYFQRGGGKSINVRWISPGQREALIPTGVLWPARP
jgi:hypothetical protein